MYRELLLDELTWRCDEAYINPGLKAGKTIIGQKRATSSIKAGLDIESAGYNIFVTGIAGTGRTTTVKLLIDKSERKKSLPTDKCYVNNFANPDLPRLIVLPAGQGRKFKRDVEREIENIIRSIPTFLEGKEHKKKRDGAVKTLKKRRDVIIESFEKTVTGEGFTVVQIQVGPLTRPDIFPLYEGEAVSFETLYSLVGEGKIKKNEVEKKKKVYEKLTTQLSDTLKKLRDLEKETEKEIKRIDRDAMMPYIQERFSEINEEYKNKKVEEYLLEVQNSILDNMDRFKEGSGDPYKDYMVNLTVDNSGKKTAPVIFEASPTFKNLFGAIERRASPEGWKADYREIKAGSLLMADGGFLILNARDILLEPGVWNALKRTLKTRRLEIQTYDPFYMLTISALKPEPVDIDIKVIMIGEPYIYHLLYANDDDFKKIFKIRADFDWVMDKNKESINEYARFCDTLAREENLLPLTRKATAGIVEYGVRLAGRKGKISTRFNNIADIIREAHYLAKKKGEKRIKRDNIEETLTNRIHRESLYQDKIQEGIGEDVIMIALEGRVTGQINGLSVYQIGEYSFGHPIRITARTGVGRGGVINIEREVDLSGPIHSKGVYILSGYLREIYAKDRPISMSASICFEQTYSGVEGDSASSAELYAILSSLAGTSLRQDIAVTGSVNQKGEIQPVGGINEKIEGFFDVCRRKGLTGDQGVIIPERNVSDLMLKEGTIEAVKGGTFHIYAVNTIEDGIEILTGRKAKYIHSLVEKTLDHYARVWKEFGGE